MTSENELNNLYDEWLVVRESQNRRWNRTLPLGEYVVDHCEKSQLLGFGEGASNYNSAVVIGKVSVGAYTWIGPCIMLDGAGGRSNVSQCSISACIQI